MVAGIGSNSGKADLAHQNDRAGKNRIANNNEKRSEPRKVESDTNCTTRGQELEIKA